MYKGLFMATRCKVCIGTGRKMGGGMMMEDCDHCINGKVLEPKDIKIDKTSDSYKGAIKRIRKLKNITTQEAEAVFDKEVVNG